MKLSFNHLENKDVLLGRKKNDVMSTIDLI